MSTRVVFLLTLAVIAAGDPRPARADRLKAARELAEFALKKLTGKVAKESAEALARKIVTASARHGDDVMRAVSKVGPRALSLADEAGEHAPRVFRLLGKHGDEAVALVARPRSLRAIGHFGDEAADVFLKHPGVAESMVENFGKPAIEALSKLGSRSARRMAIVAESAVGKLGMTEQLLGVVGRYGEKACDFIWSNRGALAVGASLTAFVSNPEPFINGSMKLGSAVVTEGAKVAQATVEHVVGPAASRVVVETAKVAKSAFSQVVAPTVTNIAEHAARSIPWGVLSMIGGVGCVVVVGGRAIRRRLAFGVSFAPAALPESPLATSTDPA